MAATVYLWHMFRFDVFHVNPPLPRAVSGLPVAVCQPEYDWDFIPLGHNGAADGGEPDDSIKIIFQARLASD